MAWTSDNDGPFVSQQYVDEYFEDTKNFVDTVDTEESAVELLKRVKYLNYVSDEFYVSNEIGMWEEMALSYIETPEALFKNVHYDIISREYQTFFDAARELEQAVIDDLLPEETLFSLVSTFNNDMEEVNVSCKKYGLIKFSEYWFQSYRLGERYQKWLAS